LIFLLHFSSKFILNSHTDTLRRGQEGHVRAERDIPKSALFLNSAGEAEWIFRLYYSFQNRDNQDLNLATQLSFTRLNVFND
jgi:hypothetical protein